MKSSLNLIAIENTDSRSMLQFNTSHIHTHSILQDPAPVDPGTFSRCGNMGFVFSFQNSELRARSSTMQYADHCGRPLLAPYVKHLTSCKTTRWAISNSEPCCLLTISIHDISINAMCCTVIVLSFHFYSICLSMPEKVSGFNRVPQPLPGSAAEKTAQPKQETLLLAPGRLQSDGKGTSETTTLSLSLFLTASGDDLFDLQNPQNQKKIPNLLPCPASFEG